MTELSDYKRIVEKPQNERFRARITQLESENEKLLKTVRKLAVKQHVRMTSGGGHIPSGFSCDLCSAEWDQEAPELHKDGCLLASPKAGAAQ